MLNLEIRLLGGLPIRRDGAAESNFISRKVWVQRVYLREVALHGWDKLASIRMGLGDVGGAIDAANHGSPTHARWISWLDEVSTGRAAKTTCRAAR